MSDVVNVDDVGYAEDVLQRLVNERKSLENAVRVMQTYRAVKTDLTELAKEYEALKGNVNVARVELERVSDTRDKEIAVAKRQVEQYKEKELSIAQEEIDKLKQMTAELEVVYQEMEAMYTEEKRVCERDIEQLRKQVRETSEVLDRLKKEHMTLAEAFRNASHIFTKE